MDQSPNLQLSYLMAAQSQKHVTYNEAMLALDALVQAMVLDKDLAAPPASPADGDRYIVAASPTGGWAAQAGHIAAWQDGSWAFFDPREGWLAWVADEAKLYAFAGSAWAEVINAGTGVALWGINATADATNRLAVKSTASLFDNVGNGHQQKINKAAAGDTASQLFQTGYSGRAEFGLTGDDNFHVKASPDGSAWHEAIVADRNNGNVGIGATSPGAKLHALNTGATVAYLESSHAGGPHAVFRKSGSDILYLGDGAGLGTGAGYADWYATAAYGLRFWAGATEAIRALTNGNVGIGLTSPACKLDVGGPARVKSYTVATLPAATLGAGMHAYVTDASVTHAAGIGTTVAGGGANKVPVVSDGTNWIIG